MRRTLWAVAVAASLVMAGSAAAQTDVTPVVTYEIEGAVGPEPVGVQLTVAGDKFIQGHYFYDKDLKDIPLTGALNGTHLSLTEPGGGVFALTLQGNGAKGGEGTSFFTSVGLTGTWTQGAKTLPVTFGFDETDPGLPRRPRYAAVTTSGDADFETQAASFLKAVLAGDKQGAAKLVSYPLTVTGAHPTTLKTPADFIAAWNSIFPPAMLTELRKAVPHEMFVHETRAMVGAGAVWFDAKGAVVLNEPLAK